MIDQVWKRISPSNNVYYFDGVEKIDIRICPKNGLSTIKDAHMLVRAKNLNATDRLIDIETHADRINPPFRKGSIRIAITRDPVERFLSAIRWLHANHPFTYDIDETIELLQSGKMVYEPHFFSQSYYLGERREYDAIYSIDSMRDLLSKLYHNHGRLDNYGAFVGLHSNRTSQFKMFSAITEQQRNNIEELYSIDYQRGWKID